VPHDAVLSRKAGLRNFGRPALGQVSQNLNDSSHPISGKNAKKKELDCFVASAPRNDELGDFRQPLNVIASDAKIPWGVDSGRV
jgi:hypothetical protein